MGIPQAHQTRLFQSFVRADNVSNIPGTGLGLVIVQRSVHMLDGTITFESKEGRGTTFTVTLPLLESLPQ
jgi:signal transduction histidine kinase